MSRAAPQEIPKGTPHFGEGRYAVLEATGALAQGELHDVWDTRLRMWRTGLRCVPSLRPALEDAAQHFRALRDPSLVRVREVCDGWIVLEATEGHPLVLDRPRPVEQAVAGVRALGGAVQALLAAGQEPEALVAELLLVTDDGSLLLPPVPCAIADSDGGASAKALSLLLAGLVQGAPLETEYDDASGLTGSLAAAHALAMGHRPHLGELLEALHAWDASDAPAPASPHPTLSRAEQLTADEERPSYVDEGENIEASGLAKRLAETRAKADALASSTVAKAAATPPKGPPANPLLDLALGLGGLAMAVVVLGVMAVGGTLGFGTMQVRGAQHMTLSAESVLAETLEMEAGALDELEELGLDPAPIRLARAVGPVHEGKALLAALDAASRPPLSERPQARVLAQRRDRIVGPFDEAVAARAAWQSAADGALGSVAISLGLAPEYQSIAEIEPEGDPLE